MAAKLWHSLDLMVFDKGHVIGIRATPSEYEESRGVKTHAFRISIETAEKMIGDLHDVLKQAAAARHEYQLDRKAGVYG